MIKSCCWWQKKYQIPPAVQSAPPSPRLRRTSKKAIIFDLDGVLCTTHTLRAFQEIGWLVTIQYILEQWRLPSQELLYRAIAAVPAKSKVRSFVADKTVMPAIMVDWQCGLQPVDDLQKAMIDHIENSQHTKIQKQFLINVIKLTLTPEKLIASRCTISAGIKLLHDLKTAGYQLYIISNWDAQSFPLLKKQFPEIFIYNNKKIFDGIITSGKTGIVKPHHKIFELALKEFGIQPSDAVFIDDVIENIQSAQNVGIQSIHCIKQNMKHVRMHLIKILKNS